MKDLKIPLFTIIFIFLGLILYTRIVGPIPFSVNSIQTTKNSFFATEGTGKATAAPDIAVVNIGVTQTSSSVVDTQDKVNKKVSSIINELKKLGMKEKDIKTTNYSVYPNYDFNGNQRITGYNVTQNLEVKVKPIEKINKVIDTATANGANISGGAQFSFSDELKEKLEKEAREEAVKKAKQKAEGLAKAAGIRLGKIVDISEQGLSQYPIPLVGRGGAIEETDRKEPTNITPGENTVSVTVSLSYEIY
ncbi:MAG: SIMPL domain-containing protein [Candidatus Levyibacteriota bacterium]